MAFGCACVTTYETQRGRWIATSQTAPRSCACSHMGARAWLNAHSLHKDKPTRAEREHMVADARGRAIPVRIGATVAPSARE